MIKPKILSYDDLVTIALFASNRFNAAALTEYLCALKLEEAAASNKATTSRAPAGSA